MAFDLDSGSDVRDAFSRVVHRRSVASIKNYWQRQIFSGREVPLEELSSDAEMIQRVARDLGAIGYVASAMPLPESVRAISRYD
jgi:hypothetical protein